MKKQSYTGTYYAIETENGTQFMPEDVCGELKGMESGVMYEPVEDEREGTEFDTWQEWETQVRDYLDGNKIRSIEKCKGKLYRLSAPGYLDCTEWTTDANGPEFDDMDAA